MSTRRWLTGLAAGVAALGAYARWVEPRWLQLRRRRVHIRGLPAALEGLRVALLTDLHAGGATPLSLVARAAAMAMRERPDLIALTGDLAADDAPGFAPVLAALGDLSAPLGVYAVPGNHDYVVGIDDWHERIRRHPSIRDLTNRAVVLDVDGARLCVAGVDDFYLGSPRLVLPPVEDRDTTVLLAHSPDQAERSRRNSDAIDLILGGHTHGGQVRLPLIGAVVTSAENPDLYESGLRRRPWTQVYTSRGIGTVGVPFRLFTRPEVTILTLTGAPRPPKPLTADSAGSPIPGLPIRLKG